MLKKILKFSRISQLAKCDWQSKTERKAFLARETAAACLMRKEARSVLVLGDEERKLAKAFSPFKVFDSIEVKCILDI